MNLWLVCFLSGVGGLVILSAFPSEALWHFKLALVVTELGHWMALLVLVSVGFLVVGTSSLWGKGAAIVLGVSLAGALLMPSIQAWRAGGGTISVLRLFAPPLGERGGEVLVKREVYHSFAEGGGDPLSLTICQPPEAREPGAALPWVLSIHGGGWNDGDPEEFLDWDCELASHGYVVIMPEYRLAPSHQWPAPREDVQAAVNWARESAPELGIDPDNLTVFGRSAGGQIASASAFGLQELGARRCVAFYAPADMVFAHQFARNDDILDSLGLVLDYMGGEPEELPESYRSASSIELAEEGRVPPTLLIHGSRDTLVWVKQSRRLSARMKESGQEVTYLELPWAGHAFDYFPFSPGGQASMGATLAFLKSTP